MIRKPKHYKNKNESSLSRIWVDVAILVLFIFAFVVVCINRHENMIEALPELVSINPFSALVLFTLLHIVFLVIKFFIYNMRKQIIISKGNVIEGKIIGTNEVRVILNRGPGPVYDFQYSVQLSDGKIVKTGVYYEDFVKENYITKCTVYEYKNHYYFTDYR